MSIETVVKCDCCGKVIPDTEGDIIEGYTIIGNVHVAKSGNEFGSGGGLIGSSKVGENNFFSEVHAFHYCRSCIKSVLMLH